MLSMLPGPFFSSRSCGLIMLTVVSTSDTAGLARSPPEASSP